jgi:hypothetical protein
MPLFSSIDVPIEDDQNNSYIKLRFNDELKSYLIKLQSRYTSIDEEILASMDGVHQKVWGKGFFTDLKEYNSFKNESQTKVLNNDWEEEFRKKYPKFRIIKSVNESDEIKVAV